MGQYGSVFCTAATESYKLPLMCIAHTMGSIAVFSVFILCAGLYKNEDQYTSLHQGVCVCVCSALFNSGLSV